MFEDDFAYKYCPILSVSPSEMTALKELPGKDKDLILPVFPIKSWATSLKLNNAIEKIESSIGESRKWIADIDDASLESRALEDYRRVHHEITALMDPNNGYENWCSFIKEHPNAIPCMQLGELSEFPAQLKMLNSLQRGIVVILKHSDLESKVHEQILPLLTGIDDLLVILDLEQITREFIDLANQILGYLKTINSAVPNALLSLSSTSFPDSFGGYHKGTKTIYERLLFEKIRTNFDKIVYSDRGSARASRLAGSVQNSVSFLYH